MIWTTILISMTALTILSCNNSKDNKMTADNNKTTSVCSDDCKAKSKSGELSCKLTTPEMQKRKETVLASFKAQMTDKKELKDGYAFKFPARTKCLMS